MGLSIVEWDQGRYASLLPPIDADASKYSRGALTVMGGSERFPGAPVLAALAAARTGAGYVTAVVPQPARAFALAHLLSVPVLGAESRDGMFAAGACRALDALHHRDAMVVGPGMGVGACCASVVAQVLGDEQCPLVLDADALNMVAGLHAPDEPHATHTGARGSAPCGRQDVFRALVRRGDAGRQTVLTPHDGELARLHDACLRWGWALPAPVQADLECQDLRLARAVNVAAATGAVVVAKGRRTIVATAHRALASQHATPALAKAGTGDVLAGVIGALCAQMPDAFQAAALGVYVHSRAGVVAHDQLGVRSVMAEDLLEAIPRALVQIEQAGRP